MNRVSGAKSQQAISLQDSISIEDPALLRQTFRQAKSVLQKIERLEKKIRIFHQDDQRLFQDWEQTFFHEKRQQFASLQNRCYVLTHFHNRILATSRLLRVSISRAYQILKDEEEVFESGSDQTRALLQRTWAERDQFAQAEVAKASEVAMEQRQAGHRIKEKAKSFAQQSSQSLTKPPWENGREELKLTYRKLVRKLHPDSMTVNSRRSVKTEWMSEYWHQAQNAYQAKDQAALEKMYVMTVIHLQDFSAMTLAEISDSADWLQRYFESLQATAQIFKRSRAWGFSKRKNYRSLIEAITKDFSRQMAPLHKQIQHLDFYHEMLEGGRKPLHALQKLADSHLRRRKRRPFVHANQTSFLEFLS